MSSKTSTKNKPARRAWDVLKFLLLGGLLGVALIASGPFLRVFTGGKILGRQVVAPPLEGKTAITILVMGLDQPDKLKPELGRRSDTLLLARMNLLTKHIYGISIPRDTRVRNDENSGWSKVNHAYVKGEHQGTLDLVSGMTGVTPDYYVVVDSASVGKLVDMVGGVEVTVDKRMKYTDTWQDLYIDLQPGFQRLNGEQAVGFIRYRKDLTGDLARIKRQQVFLRALAKRIVAPENLPSMNRIVRELRRQVRTDLEDIDLLYLANTLKDMPSANIQLKSLEGESRTIRGISYFLPFRKKMEESIQTAFPGAALPEESLVDTL